MPTSTYTTPGWHTYTVPKGVTWVTVTVNGAGSNGRRGGRVTGKIAVKAGQKLLCHVGRGGRPNSGSTGGTIAAGGGGAAGNGRTYNGGWGGGGYSAIRLGSTIGTVKAVAGGAGGSSGDGGQGGLGGGVTGGSGLAGTAGSNAVGAATGGTYTQGGNGGTSSAGAAYNGANALDGGLSTGGKGGTPPSGTGHGGGGGGGGWRGGGGGQASAQGYSPGGGGGGGSSYTGGLTGPANTQGGGNTADGSISVVWVSPAPANQPPVVPRDVKLNNVAVTSGMLTKATTSVKITANLIDTDKQNVRMMVRISTRSDFATKRDIYSGWVTYHKDGRVASVTVTGLSQNTLYYVRVYSQDYRKLFSVNYSGFTFWTNKSPTSPTELRVNNAQSGMTLPSLASAVFTWQHNDPDLADYEAEFQIQYRRAATSTQPAGGWTVIRSVSVNTALVPGPPSSSSNTYTFNPGTFTGNYFYEWQVRTKDRQGAWGAWSLLFTLRSQSTNSPPTLLTPTSGTALDVFEDNTFTWRFVDPDASDRQQKADIRYRVLGHTKEVTSGTAPPPSDSMWITIPGATAPGVPGGTSAWTILANTFAPGYTYEWQVRTYDSAAGVPSPWSNSFRFIAIETPGSGNANLPLPDVTVPGGSLGCGSYRVFIYQQGGQRLIGEVEPITRLVFNRVRDDISGCTIFTNGYSADCGALYGRTRSWMHELVVYRDGVRVWEGPITRIGYSVDSVEMEAKDVMAYAYRRILKVGYNDAYRFISKTSTGQNIYTGVMSVVTRARLLLTQALAPYDPNVLPYLTTIDYPDDAQETRVVADWSRTAWEEVDDLAATAGLDYTVVGRRILLWDTHRAIGRLPEFRDGDFNNAPIVTEYGMQLATFFAVTNGAGVAGTTEVPAKSDPYGPIELLASSYSDSGAASTEILTPAALAAAQLTLIEQAKRNIAGRWPAPLVVRIPDNSTVSPKANVSFQQLIPGVWLPLRSIKTPREVLQWQKLDSVSVEVTEGDEKVNVVMSPAPNGGEDPDANVAPAD